MKRTFFAVFIFISLHVFALGESDFDELRYETLALKQEVAQLKQAVSGNSDAGYLRAQSKGMPNTSADNRRLSPLYSLPRQWLNPISVFHLTGYADVGYISAQGTPSHFNLGRFNPIFHYLYNDLILAEGELELEVNSEGETETKLEYGDLALFLNNYAALVVGKLVSPLGFFVQNLHPSWINKLPSNPVGFRHDEAAPAAAVGAELRGGFNLGQTSRINYAVYVSNGPKAMVDGGEIEEIENEGFNADTDGKKVWGGRVGFLPAPNIEVGVSGASGHIGLFDETTSALLEQQREYDVLGADATFRMKGLDMRGEIIEQKIGSSISSVIPGGKWRGWYTQAAYRLKSTKFEGVVRYGEYTTPHASKNQSQWAVGLNYWFAPSVVGKVAYEVNSGVAGTTTDANRFIFQLSYGF